MREGGPNRLATTAKVNGRLNEANVGREFLAYLIRHGALNYRPPAPETIFTLTPTQQVVLLMGTGYPFPLDERTYIISFVQKLGNKAPEK